MLEHAAQYYPESMRIYYLLMKIYSKLGLSATVTNVAKKIKPRTDLTVYSANQDYERLAANRLSVVSSYGQSNLQDELINEVNQFFQARIIENKNNIVNCYHTRDFERIFPLVQMGEMYEQQNLLPIFKVAKAVSFIQKNLLESEKTHALFNKYFSQIDEVCEHEGPSEIRFNPKGPVDSTARKKLIHSSLKPLKLGLDR